MSAFHHVQGPDTNHLLVEAWSTERLPFEPEGWKLKFRNEIRAALRSLSSLPDSSLIASYISPTKGFCDVENILFYNVGSAPFAHLRNKRICFERVFAKPPTPPCEDASDWNHYLSYQLTSEERPFTYWKPLHLPLAKWENLPCGVLTSTSKATSVWHRFKLGIAKGKVQRLISHSVLPTNLGLKLTIHAPKGTSFNLTSVIKPLVDGIVAAFSSHDGSNTSLISGRLASALNVNQSDIERLLVDRTMDILGTGKLVRPRARGVQWNPKDDLLVAGDILLVDDTFRQEWQLSGELVELRLIRP